MITIAVNFIIIVIVIIISLLWSICKILDIDPCITNTLQFPRVIESSLRIGDPIVNVVARIIYSSSDELFHIVQEIKKMPNVTHAEWSEIVKVVGRNNALMLTG